MHSTFGITLENLEYVCDHLRILAFKTEFSKTSDKESWNIRFIPDPLLCRLPFWKFWNQASEEVGHIYLASAFGLLISSCINQVGFMGCRTSFRDRTLLYWRSPSKMIAVNPVTSAEVVVKRKR